MSVVGSLSALLTAVMSAFSTRPHYATAAHLDEAIWPIDANRTLDSAAQASRRNHQTQGPEVVTFESSKTFTGLSESKLDQHRQQPLAEALVAAAQVSTNNGATNSSQIFEEFINSGPMTTMPLVSSVSSSLISATTMSSVTNETPSLATVTYNGLIGINGTDPFAVTTESRSFSLPTEVQIIMCLFYGTLAFTAIASNMIVCYIVLSNQRMRTATNYFIVNLAVGDILMALLCIPFTFPTNLIFQYWPFGLSLCVIVSYSQANSVFISAYTMVAISIDKYIAIMYPMRLRMPKNQAKIIILAIWSAALLTSLPTALLSRLTPTSDSSAPTQTIAPTTPSLSSSTGSSLIMSTATMNPKIEFIASTMMTGQLSNETNLPTRSFQDDNSELENIRTTPSMNDERQQQKSSPASGANSYGRVTSDKISWPSSVMLTSSPLSTTQTASTATLTTTANQQQQDYEGQRNYFCQESWNFWPPGKYYYSMALMILQFALPLFVLVITYTRIVVVVWGKKMPGEGDNARDARMARSKRKMIKMVIFCVIAFALTWLPFNALILVGDIHPVIWEHNHIMYIWFVTHYLAMCHTITNPLIYIWMNNRFRAGFKQVISDICKFLEHLIAYLFCYFLCLGCCFKCSRQKYARLAMDIDRKRGAGRGPLTNSGSTNPHSNSNHLNNQHNFMTTGTMTGNTTKNSNCDKMVVSSLNESASKPAMRTGGGSRQGTGAGVEVSLANYPNEFERGQTVGRVVQGQAPGDSSAHLDTPHGTLVSINYGGLIAPISCTQSGDDQMRGRAKNCRRVVTLEDESVVDGCGTSRQTGPISRTSVDDREDAGRLDKLEEAKVEASDIPQSKQEVERQPPRSLRQLRIFRRLRAHNITNDDECSKKGLRKKATKEMGNSSETTSTTSTRQQQATKKRRRRNQSHAISLRMTTSEFHPANKVVNACKVEHELGCANNSAASNETGKWRLRRTKNTTRRKLNSALDCPVCWQSIGKASDNGKAAAVAKETTTTTTMTTKEVRARKQAMSANSKYYVVELRQSSQSMATISAQTNNTSLAISPLNSTKGSQIECANNGNNTSASLSAQGDLGSQNPARLDESSSYIHEAPRENQSKLEASGGNQQRDGPLLTHVDAQENELTNAGTNLNFKSDLGANRADAARNQWTRSGSCGQSPKGNQQLDHDPFNESSPSRACVSLGLEHKQRADRATRLSGCDGCTSEALNVATAAAAVAITYSFKRRSVSGGTSSGATSLEGHQLASSRSATTSRNEDDFNAAPIGGARAKRRHRMPNSAGQRNFLAGKFCRRHRAAELDHCRLLAASYDHDDDDENYLKTDDRSGFRSVSQRSIWLGASNEEAKSSSTFELVSDQLLQLLGRRRQKNAYEAQERENDVRLAHARCGENNSNPSSSDCNIGNEDDDDSNLGLASNTDEEEEEEARNLVDEYGDSPLRTRDTNEMIQMRIFDSAAANHAEPLAGTSGANARLLQAPLSNGNLTLYSNRYKFKPRLAAEEAEVSVPLIRKQTSPDNGLQPGRGNARPLNSIFVDFAGAGKWEIGHQQMRSNIKSLAGSKFAQSMSPINLRHFNQLATDTRRPAERYFHHSHLLDFSHESSEPGRIMITRVPLSDA